MKPRTTCPLPCFPDGLPIVGRAIRLPPRHCGRQRPRRPARPAQTALARGNGFGHRQRETRQVQRVSRRRSNESGGTSPLKMLENLPGITSLGRSLGTTSASAHLHRGFNHTQLG